MSKHETWLQYTKVFLLSAILIFAGWSISSRPPAAEAAIFQVGTGLTGQPVPAIAQQIAGSDGTNLRALSVNAAGQFVLAAPAVSATGSGQTGITASATGAASTATATLAAPAAGFKIYITDITVDTTTATAGTWRLETGTGTNCATGTAALYPNSANAWTAPVLGAPQHFTFTTPLSAPAAAAVCILGVVTNTVNIDLTGFIAP